MQVYREDTPETQKNKPLEQIIPLLHLPQIHSLAELNTNPPICVP